MNSSNQSLKSVKLQTEKIRDWDSFHIVFSELMGFPDFYGRNMNAWIDCMSYINEPGALMSHVSLNPGEILALEIVGTENFAHRLPEIFTALVECASFVNLRHVNKGNPPVIVLVFL